MTNAISARQRALLRIWDSERADDLLEIMAQEAAARHIDLTPELQRQAELCEPVNPVLSRRLRRIATAVAEIHAIVDRFAGITDMPGLLACHKAFPLCWSKRFNRVLGAFWVDAFRGDQASRRDGLRRALTFLSRVYFSGSLLNRLPQMNADLKIKTVRDNPVLRQNPMRQPNG